MFLNATQMVNTYQPGYLTNGFSNTPTSTFFNQTPNIIYDGNIQSLVDDWISGGSNKQTVHNDHGHISAWDVSSITNMTRLFQDKTTFNDDIGNWDVSGVTIMSYMFNNAVTFHQDIGNWDVFNVIDMYDMFANAVTFNQDISHWDVSSVTDMRTMFRDAEDFNQDIRVWDVSNVSYFGSMFDGGTAMRNQYGISGVTPDPNFGDTPNPHFLVSLLEFKILTNQV